LTFGEFPKVNSGVEEAALDALEEDARGNNETGETLVESEELEVKVDELEGISDVKTGARNEIGLKMGV